MPNVRSFLAKHVPDREEIQRTLFPSRARNVPSLIRINSYHSQKSGISNITEDTAIGLGSNRNDHSGRNINDSHWAEEEEFGPSNNHRNPNGNHRVKNRVANQMKNRAVSLRKLPSIRNAKESYEAYENDGPEDTTYDVENYDSTDSNSHNGFKKNSNGSVKKEVKKKTSGSGNDGDKEKGPKKKEKTKNKDKKNKRDDSTVEESINTASSKARKPQVGRMKSLARLKSKRKVRSKTLTL